MTEFGNPEDEFKGLDEAREFAFFASALWKYQEALIEVGFRDDQAFHLVAAYSKFIYDMGIEEFLAEKFSEDESVEDDEDVDPDVEI